jgi:hypothetical protein
LQGVQREKIVSAEQLFIWISFLIASTPSISVVAIAKEKKGKTLNSFMKKKE